VLKRKAGCRHPLWRMQGVFDQREITRIARHPMPTRI
jgi:hypothetical protein